MSFTKGSNKSSFLLSNENVKLNLSLHTLSAVDKWFFKIIRKSYNSNEMFWNAKNPVQ